MFFEETKNVEFCKNLSEHRIAKWITVISEFSKFHEALNHEEIVYILKNIYRINKEKYQNCLEDAISDDKGLFKVLLGCIVQEYISGGGSVSYKLQKANLLKGLESSDIYERLESIDTAPYGTYEIMTKAIYKKAFKYNFNGKYYYNRSTFEVKVDEKYKTESNEII